MCELFEVGSRVAAPVASRPPAVAEPMPMTTSTTRTGPRIVRRFSERRARAHTIRKSIDRTLAQPVDREAQDWCCPDRAQTGCAVAVWHPALGAKPCSWLVLVGVESPRHDPTLVLAATTSQHCARGPAVRQSPHDLAASTDAIGSVRQLRGPKCEGSSG